MHVNAECGGALLSQVKDPGASTEDKGLSCYGVATPARFCPETPTGAGRAVAAKASARLLFGAADRVTPTLPLKALGASSTRPAARGGGAGSTQHAWLSSDGEPAQSEYDGVCEKRIAWLRQAQIAPDCKTEGRPARWMAAFQPSDGGSAGRQPGCYIPSAAVTGFLHYLLFRGRSCSIRAAGGSLALAKL
jgi:hypothetical protein